MKERLHHLTRWLILGILFIQIGLPLISLATHVSAADISKVFRAPQFLPMLWNSVYSTTLATVVSVGLALVLAWCLHRSQIRHKNLLALLFTVPMLIPSISHGMSLTLLFGDNGVITNLTGLNIHLFGLTGIVLGATLYAFPSAFLMLTDSFRYEDYTTYEVAQVLGLSKLQQARQITLPNLKKPLIATVFAVFTMVFTDYGVPLVVGGKMTTLPVYMYREVVGLLDTSKGGVLGLVLLLPAVLAFVIDLLNSETAQAGTVMKAFTVRKNNLRDFIASILCWGSALLLLLPLATFGVLCFVNRYPIDFSFSLTNLIASYRLGVGGYLLNSLFIALTTALVGTALAYGTAYFTARSKRTFSSMALHLISLVTLSVPGIVLGLSFMLLFQGSLLYGTFAILISVNLIHFFASPYLMAYNALLKLNKNFEDVAGTLGITRFQLLRDVLFPCTYDTVFEMFGYIFANAMVTISAVSFLANFRNMPLALLIPQFDSQALIGPIAVISVVILIVNVSMKLLIFFLKCQFRRQGTL